MENLKITRKNDSVTLSEMKDGDLAVIMKWHNEDQKAQLIRLAKDTVELIGGHSGNSYTTLLETNAASNGECMVRIIQPGEKVEFTL